MSWQTGEISRLDLHEGVKGMKCFCFSKDIIGQKWQEFTSAKGMTPGILVFKSADSCFHQGETEMS